MLASRGRIPYRVLNLSPQNAVRHRQVIHDVLGDHQSLRTPERQNSEEDEVIERVGQAVVGMMPRGRPRATAKAAAVGLGGD